MIVQPNKPHNMIEWLAYEREKLEKAQNRIKQLHKELDNVTDLVEYTKILNEMAAIKLKIEAIESRLKNNWSKSRMETYSLKD